MRGKSGEGNSRRSGKRTARYQFRRLKALNHCGSSRSISVYNLLIMHQNSKVFTSMAKFKKP
jgi:hypothetical protein